MSRSVLTTLAHYRSWYRFLIRVDAQWITAKKDWDNAQRHTKAQVNAKEDPNVSLPSNDPPTRRDTESGMYEKHMDEMRCILYSHGGKH